MDSYLKSITELLAKIENEDAASMAAASDAVADVICRDGIVHVFGCGHSHLPALTRSTVPAGWRASPLCWTRT